MPDADESATRILDAARELSPKIRAAANEIEQGRRLPLPLVREMQRAGMLQDGHAARVGRTRAGFPHADAGD